SPQRFDATDLDREGPRRAFCHGLLAHTRARARTLVRRLAARGGRIYRSRHHCPQGTPRAVTRAGQAEAGYRRPTWLCRVEDLSASAPPTRAKARARVFAPVRDIVPRLAG